MKKTIIAGICTLLTLCFGPEIQTVSASEITAATTTATDELISVQITLVNGATGAPVTNHGLQGFWARNEATGVYYYSDYSDTFEELPEGTYTFGAFNGYFDGASQETVTLDASNGNFTVVTLSYWVE